MTQLSRFWNGTTVGDATDAPYDAPDEFAAVLRSLNGANANSNRSGVCRGELNLLAVTAAGGISPIQVDTGRAFVHGTWFENDAAVSFNIDPTPATQSRIDYVILRKTWATQQVRLAILKGTDAVVPVAPTLTQNTTTGIWEFPLYQLTIVPAGTITLVDVRQYVPYLSAQIFDKISDLILPLSTSLVSFDITGQAYRMYMAVVNARIATALHGPESLGLYFTPSSLTAYDWAVLQTFGSPPLSHSAPGSFNTWYLDVGNVGESSPYTTRYPQSIIFITNLQEFLDKNVFSLGTGLSAGLFVAISAGTYKYANPVTGINFCIVGGDSFEMGSRFTLYGIT